ncbi:hypothetical protein B0J17DRAFT_343375 [Rhizoctonia solani]|nr:hypothetical protein B0J17DRAFT_343375 [Rhizoctonia solani]
MVPGVALLFVLAPLPNAIFAHCNSDDFTDYDGNNAAIDIGRFLTGMYHRATPRGCITHICAYLSYPTRRVVAGIVVTAFALPLVLAHADVIKPTACGMAIVGGGLVYGTILAYSAVFKSGEDEF